MKSQLHLKWLLSQKKSQKQLPVLQVQYLPSMIGQFKYQKDSRIIYNKKFSFLKKN